MRSVLLLVVGLTTAVASGQNVVVVRGVPLTWFGSIDAADFDGDGDLDLAVIGQRLDGSSVTGLYTFQGRIEEPIPLQSPRLVGVYEQLSFPARKMINGQATWADVDADGDHDLLLTGTAIDDIDINRPEEVAATDVYENEGNSLLIRGSSGLPPLTRSRAAVRDIDSDGDADLALSGLASDGTPLLEIWVHESSFSFRRLPLDLPPIVADALDWGDFDGDGDPDLFVAGLLDGQPTTLLGRNRGGGDFVTEPTSLPNHYFSSAAAGDFDGDGDDDLLLTGGTLNPNLLGSVADVYRSTPAGFEPTNAGLQGTFAGEARWGDYDGDGDLDILLGGVSSLLSREDQHVRLYRQEAGGHFARVVSIRGVLFGTTAWFDYEGNGKMDILMAGRQEDKLVMSIFEF